MLDPRILKYHPIILRDSREPFEIRWLGYTIFDEPGPSPSFQNLELNPAREGAEFIIEYAIYYDYDIQHLYDLEHIWAAVDAHGQVCGCWGSFHGMRLKASGIETFQTRGSHPVLYAQPGKHAMLPDPKLFGLLPDLFQVCGELAGGGLLIPDMLSDRMRTDAEQDRRIRAYIRERFSFKPSLEFETEPLRDDQFIPWAELFARIPELVEQQLHTIGLWKGED